ncbi:autophagy protein Apg6 family protein [Cavenderia fasciculata]|uniref:Autophagy protein Apg6 family protein n=1 Tax=Cavenderia fasciculata TaxID=261658 RepID=F4PUL0_CACFS|nr:autophagy protein Apg6 family protein [Cavenderia fasciculata]EGG21874.1 autophagy protein Apg6 family protein [Cavenderia fasciculata]|eukprot:XP_004359725.1 autophagy protein Apg6 family protein [Cavenderia fasciculata]
MDFFCQRCSKPLELDESLLEIDQSLFVNKDEISNIIKDISLKTKIASAAAATNEQEQQRAEQLQLQQQLQKNAATTTSVSKFSRGLFNRKSNKDSPLKDQINTSSNNLSNTLTTNNNNNNTTINTSTSTLNNNTQQTTQPFFTPISSSSTLNNNNGSISGSPTSFGSLSQHRLSSSISSSSSSSTFLKGASTGKLPTIDVGTMSSSSSSSSSSSMNRPIKGSTSSMTRGSEDFSKSYEPGMLKRMASQQNKRHHLSNSTKNLAINTSINKHPILASPPGKSSTMMQHSSNSLMSSPVQSHHGGKTQKLKYLRSNEKSQSMASLDHLHMHQSTASSSLTSTPLMNPINHSMSAINTAAIAGGVGGSSTTSTPIGSPPMMVQGGNSSTTGTPTQIGMGVSVGSSRYLQAMSLFKLVTDLISYDLPLCLECTKMAIHEMDDENGVLEAEIDVRLQLSTSSRNSKRPISSTTRSTSGTTVTSEHINGMPIKVQFTNDDTWTKALKYMLTNLKWLLSWVAKNESTQPMNIIAQQQQQQKHQPPPTSQQQQTNTTRS